MKLKKITETSKVNDPFFFASYIKSAEAVLCLLVNRMVAQWNRGNCGDGFCCLYACVQLHDLTLAYVLVAFKAFSAHAWMNLEFQTVSWPTNRYIYLHIYICWECLVLKSQKMISQFSQNHQLAHYVLQESLTNSSQKWN